MTPEQKARLDTCVEFYKQQMEHYHKTQEVEWKGTFGAWALAASAVALTFQEGVSFRSGWWLLLAVLVPACHITWLRLVHASQEEDKKLWTYYRNEASVLVELHEKYKDYAGRHGWREFFWIATEAGPTLALVGIFIWRVLAGLCERDNYLPH